MLNYKSIILYTSLAIASMMFTRMIDALAIARKLVNLPAPPTVDVTLADTNKNSRLDINDALFIARFAIGLVLPPEACNVGQPL